MKIQLMSTIYENTIDENMIDLNTIDVNTIYGNTIDKNLIDVNGINVNTIDENTINANTIDNLHVLLFLVKFELLHIVCIVHVLFELLLISNIYLLAKPCFNVF